MKVTERMRMRIDEVTVMEGEGNRGEREGEGDGEGSVRGEGCWGLCAQARDDKVWAWGRLKAIRSM